jgi:hypothetical protein
MDRSSSSIGQNLETEKIGSFIIMNLKIRKRKLGSSLVTKRHLPTDSERSSMAIKFRPFLLSPKYRLKYWLQFGKHVNYNFIDRKKNYTLSSFPGVYKIGSQLHYLADHAPLPVQKKWKHMFRKFCQRYRKF